MWRILLRKPAPCQQCCISSLRTTDLHCPRHSLQILLPCKPALGYYWRIKDIDAINMRNSSSDTSQIITNHRITSVHVYSEQSGIMSKQLSKSLKIYQIIHRLNSSCTTLHHILLSSLHSLPYDITTALQSVNAPWRARGAGYTLATSPFRECPIVIHQNSNLVYALHARFILQPQLAPSTTDRRPHPPQQIVPKFTSRPASSPPSSQLLPTHSLQPPSPPPPSIYPLTYSLPYSFFIYPYPFHASLVLHQTICTSSRHSRLPLALVKIVKSTSTFTRQASTPTFLLQTLVSLTSPPRLSHPTTQ